MDEEGGISRNLEREMRVIKAEERRMLSDTRSQG
jgi:hypothetical protein